MENNVTRLPNRLYSGVYKEVDMLFDALLVHSGAVVMLRPQLNNYSVFPAINQLDARILVFDEVGRHYAFSMFQREVEEEWVRRVVGDHIDILRNLLVAAALELQA